MIEYEKINLTSKDCSCSKNEAINKIDIKPSQKPEYYQINNYFSELVHKWEKDAAKFNLGIQELENIEYKTTQTETGEVLTKVIFKYRNGHELTTKEFIVSPKGEKGDKGDRGIQGPQGERGSDGTTPTLNDVRISWVTDYALEGGNFVENCLHGGYDLEIRIKRPSEIEELGKILDTINSILISSYVSKSELSNALTVYAKKSEIKDPDTLSLEFTSRTGELRLKRGNSWFSNSIFLEIPQQSDYTLNLQNKQLSLLKDGLLHSQVDLNALVNSIIAEIHGDTLTIMYVAYGISAPAAPGQAGAPNWSTNLPNTTDTYPYIWMAVRKNNEDWKIIRLTGRDGTSQGIVGSTIRIRGIWKTGTTYYYNSSEGNLKYIDVVLFRENETDNFTYYKCLKSHTSSNESKPNVAGSVYWEAAELDDFAYLKVLIAENANIKYLDSNEVRIFDDNHKLVAGMTSGHASSAIEDDPIDESTIFDDVRIWAGNTLSGDNVDLTLAPFLVTQSGKLRATDAVINGDVTVNSLTLSNDVTTSKYSYLENISSYTLPKETNHRIIFIFTGDNDTELIPGDNVALIYNVDGEPTISTNKITLLRNKVYLVVNTNIGWRVTLLENEQISHGETITKIGYNSPEALSNILLDHHSHGIPSDFEGGAAYTASVTYDSIPEGTTVAQAWDRINTGNPKITATSADDTSGTDFEIIVSLLPVDYALLSGLTVSGYITISNFTLLINNYQLGTFRIKSDLYNSQVALEISRANLLTELYAYLLTVSTLRAYFQSTVTALKTIQLKNGTLISLASGQVLGEVDSTNVYNYSGKKFLLKNNDPNSQSYNKWGLISEADVTELADVNYEEEEDPDGPITPNP